ncbi:MAG: hypothetical protein ABIQ84_09450 [Usitatibacter sp.]
MGQRISNYQTPRRREIALPPRWVTPPRVIERTPLAQFVILSMLLHLMFILVFGAPTGGSRDGRAMWGAFRVALQSPAREPAPALPVEEKLVAPAPVVPVRRPREDGVPVTPLAPGVAKEIERTAVPESRPEPFAFPPLLDRIVTPERTLEMAPPLQLPKASEAAPAPPPPEVRAPPVEAAAPPPPVERAPVETPALPAVTPTPPVERPPVEIPALPAPRIETLAPPRIEPVPKPVETAPSQEIPVSPKPPPTIERVEPRLPPTTRPEPVEAPAKIEREIPRSAPSALGEGRGEGLIPRRTEPSREYDPTAPSIDLDAVRSRAGEIAREGIGRRGLLAFPMPALPERKTKMETAIENARKPDCRTAYQNLGLAAIVPLIANEFGEGKCRW